jgi:hypothetical protein
MWSQCKVQAFSYRDIVKVRAVLPNIESDKLESYLKDRASPIGFYEEGA